MNEQLLEKLLTSVKKMRDAQKNYYKSPSKQGLIVAKQWEADVDKRIKEVEELKNPQQTLL